VGKTRPAQEWTKGKPIALYDGEEFVQLWRRAQAQKTPVQESARQRRIKQTRQSPLHPAA